MEFSEYIDYLVSIVTRCSGFVRSVGYITHKPGLIIMMTEQETFLLDVVLPIPYDLSFTARIKDLCAYPKDKVDGTREEFFKYIYFSGYNIKELHILNYYTGYCRLNNNSPIYYEEDIMNIPGMVDQLENSDISNIKVIHNNQCYYIPASKAIIKLNKGDKCSLSIYDHVYGFTNSNTVRYTIYKDKLKLYTNIWFNILKIQ